MNEDRFNQYRDTLDEIDRMFSVLLNSRLYQIYPDLVEEIMRIVVHDLLKNAPDVSDIINPYFLSGGVSLVSSYPEMGIPDVDNDKWKWYQKISLKPW